MKPGDLFETQLPFKSWFDIVFASYRMYLSSTQAIKPTREIISEFYNFPLEDAIISVKTLEWEALAFSPGNRHFKRDETCGFVWDNSQWIRLGLALYVRPIERALFSTQSVSLKHEIIFWNFSVFSSSKMPSIQFWQVLVHIYYKWSTNEILHQFWEMIVTSPLLCAHHLTHCVPCILSYLLQIWNHV